MKIKFNERTNRISIDRAIQIYQLKLNVTRNEFNNYIKGLADVETVMPQIKTAYDFQQSQPLINALLLSHPKINKGWYSIAKGPDTIYARIGKYGHSYTRQAIQQYQKEWTREQLNSIDSSRNISTVISRADSLHWLIASKYKLADSSVLVMGLDMNLKDMQRYLWSVEPSSQAAAFIVDEKGTYVANPEQIMIGTQMPGFTSYRGKRIALADSVSSYEITRSSYLQVPVVRFYTPLNIGPADWTAVIEMPVFLIDEDVKAIEKYAGIMFAATAVLILALIAWAQAKWQKEFMLRQKSEMDQQELTLEKQALNLNAERQQKENALLQLGQLKEKVNPHFLFNSLSSLNGLIDEHPEMAKSFVVKLSRVYRYVLDPAPDGLARVTDEVRFAREYFFLLRIRFGEALAPLAIHLSDEHAGSYVPFMSFQTLIENAVKHNVLSKARPLYIAIQSEGDAITVSNNLQLRQEPKDGGGQGLKYLQMAYAHFGDFHLQHGTDAGEYKCILPVIDSSFTP